MASRRWWMLTSVLLPLMLVRAIDACVLTPILIKVGSSFMVQVADRGHPMVGVEVALEPHESPTAKTATDPRIAVTDRDGRAGFFDVLPGPYIVSVQRGGIGSSALVEVGSTRQGDQTTLIELEWPGKTALRSRTLSGRFTAWLSSSRRDLPVPLEGASLTLTNAATGEQVWQGTTDSSGQFMAPAMAARLYILAIRESALHETRPSVQIEGAFPVEINDAASQAELNVELTMTSCGLSYTSGCAKAHLVAPKACGAITDSLGSAIGRAQIALDRIDGTESKNAESRPDGRFDLGAMEPGEYRLSVGRIGFSSANVGLTLMGSPERSACETPLKVDLRIAGQCSSATVELH